MTDPHDATTPEGELDICKCGDYRRDHKNGVGACRQADDITHGFKRCRRFRLSALNADEAELLTPPEPTDKQSKGGE
jgi:hypothetical protein